MSIRNVLLVPAQGTKAKNVQIKRKLPRSSPIKQKFKVTRQRTTVHVVIKPTLGSLKIRRKPSRLTDSRPVLSFTSWM